LKIADFGFAAPLAGRDGSHTMSTVLGTFGYMAPEIIFKRPYNGVMVDLFSSAVILFIMVAGHPPFNRADYTTD
jgi:serine/threonine protein kinase